MPVIGEPYAQPAEWVAVAMAPECAALSREFPGIPIHWRPMRGFTADLPGEDPVSSPSRSALRCFLLQYRNRVPR